MLPIDQAHTERRGLDPHGAWGAGVPSRQPALEGARGGPERARPPAGPRGGRPHGQLDVAGEARGLPTAGLGRQAGGGQGPHPGIPGTPPPPNHTRTKLS